MAVCKRAGFYIPAILTLIPIKYHNSIYQYSLVQYVTIFAVIYSIEILAIGIQSEKVGYSRRLVSDKKHFDSSYIL